MTITYPVPVDPTGIDAAGKGSLYFVPTIANPKSPTIAELNAGINLSNVVYAWALNGTQGKTERTRYGYKSTAESLGRTTYAPDAIEYDYNPQAVDATSGEYKHVALMAPGTTGYIIDRRGLRPSEAFASGQILEAVIPVELGEQMPVNIDPTQEGQMIRYSQSVAVIGDVERRVKIAS